MKGKTVNILALGDICSAAGTEFIEKKLWGARSLYGVDMVVANGENATAGNGLDKATAEILLKAGVDVITGGNHTFRRQNVAQFLEDAEAVLRPANYPPGTPGQGYCIFNLSGYRVLVINLLGTVFMDSLESPFLCADRILSREAGNFDICLVDIHAEATSEKVALANYLDGRVSAVFGTHTHVQTADERILKGGTGLISDLGMCGVEDSVLGIRCDVIIQNFLTKIPMRHADATGDCMLCGCLFTIDTESGMCTEIQRLCIR